MNHHPPKQFSYHNFDDLSAEDLENLLEFYTEEELEEIICFLEQSNNSLRLKLDSKHKEIENLKAANSILLKKLWSGIDEEYRLEAAPFFEKMSTKFRFDL